MKDKYEEKEWDAMNHRDILPQPGEMYIGHGSPEEFGEMAVEQLVIGSFGATPDLSKMEDLGADELLALANEPLPKGHAMWMRTISGDVHFLLLHEDQVTTIVNYWMNEKIDDMQGRLESGGFSDISDEERRNLSFILKEGRKIISDHQREMGGGDTE